MAGRRRLSGGVGSVNRDRRMPKRREYRLRVRAALTRSRPAVETDVADIAPWVIVQVRAWPRSVEDRLVAVGMGVWLQHVQTVRAHAPACDPERTRRRLP